MPLEKKLFDTNWSNYTEKDLSVDFIGYLEYEGILILKAEIIVHILKSEGSSYDKIFDFIRSTFLKTVVGNFAIIVTVKGISIMACDVARTYPLYFIERTSGIVVTDHLGELSIESEADNEAMEEFLLSGLVTGNKTVYNMVKGLLAGELCISDGTELEFYRYFKLRSEPLRTSKKYDEDVIFNDMDNLFLTVFRRMIASCPDVNNWIVPLSGGYDSRLIINYLNRLGCKNVICFTYGDPTSNEAVLSKRAAESLGFKWYFVEYSDDLLKKMLSDKLVKEFVRFSFNGCCMPHLQDMPAILSLKEKGIICEKDVLVPGHTAFTEAESRRVKEIKSTEEALIYIYHRYYKAFRCNKVKPSFINHLNNLLSDGGQDMNSFPEYFNWQERQSKFINNSVRVYEYTGFRWRIPLWEMSVMAFWHNLNFDDRIKRSIYFRACNEKLFKEVLKEVPVVDKFKKSRETKRRVYCYIPQILVSLFTRITNKNSDIAERTNLLLMNQAGSIFKLAGPLRLYPSNIRYKIASIGPRRLNQVNYCIAMAIYTLRNEVISRSQNKL